MIQKVKVYDRPGNGSPLRLVFSEELPEGGTAFVHGDVIYFSKTVYSHDTYKMYKLAGGEVATFLHPISPGP